MYGPRALDITHSAQNSLPKYYNLPSSTIHKLLSTDPQLQPAAASASLLHTSGENQNQVTVEMEPEEPVRPENGNVLNGVVDDEDDLPILSSHALAALKEFMEEQNQLNVDDDESRETGEKVSLVSEDWRLSQFWYDPSTAEAVAMEVIALLGNNSPSNSYPRVACIACPTLYAYLKKIAPDVSVQLLEFDKRFEQYGSDFVYYDYNLPEELPSELKHAFQVVVADPPYLSKECLEKVQHTISFLRQPGRSNLLLLTGEVQTDRAAELLGLHPCGFRPQHSSKLGNEFRLFTDYDPGTRLGGWELEK